ncbi:MAG: GtrA family protein [Acidimicrobiia bacterium]
MKALVAKLVRYAAVSAICTTLSLTILAVLVGTRAMSAGWANIVATLGGIGPSFELNRRWVWGRKGGRSLAAEVVPFAVLSVSALVLSTVAVSAAAGWASRAGFSNGTRALVALIANVVVFGTIWVVQYVICDRVLFKRPSLTHA